MGNKREYPIVAKRCKEVRKAKGKTFKNVYDETGNEVTQSLLSDLESDTSTRQVGHEVIIRLAKCYGVSSDYLLGLSTHQSLNEDIQMIEDTTGLDVLSIEALIDLRNREKAELVPFWSEEREYLRGDSPIPTYFHVLNAMLSSPVYMAILGNLRDACVYNEDDTVSVYAFGEERKENARDLYKGMAITAFSKLIDEIITASDERSEQGAE